MISSVKTSTKRSKEMIILHAIHSTQKNLQNLEERKPLNSKYDSLKFMIFTMQSNI